VKEFKLPDPGEGLLEAEIVEWKVAVGDQVKVNDIVVEVETAKSLVELPIPWAGTVVALLAEVGQEVAVGTPIIQIDDGSGDSGAQAPGSRAGSEEGSAGRERAGSGSGASDSEEEPVKLLVGSGPKAEGTRRRARRVLAATEGVPDVAAAPAEPTEPAGRPGRPEPSSEPAAAPAQPAPTPEQTRALAKPPVRKLAKDLGVDLDTIAGSGAGGIVTRSDVESAAVARGAEPDRSGPAHPSSSLDSSVQRGTLGAPPEGVNSRGETRTPIKSVRKVTAQAMVASAFTAPHVTEWITVDVTETMRLVERLKADREFRDVKVTPLLILAKAMCLAVRRNPQINAAWDEAAQEIAVKHYVNLGIAAATPRGLMVPNIKDADLLSLRELAEAISTLTATAREGRTPPADMAGGTITITNVGVFGVDTGTPILNPGEAAIMAFGVIRKQPWVVTEDGVDAIAIRHVTTLGLSFDHRLVDGELGSRYLADVAALLEDPGRALVWG